MRVRSRQLAEGCDPLEQNAWDDVAMAEEEVSAAEALIHAQPLASEGRADECKREARANWDRHYSHNPGNYHDRRYLRNEYPTLLSPARGRVVDDEHACVRVLETGCGVGNTMLPLLALSPGVAVIGCDLSQTAVRFANERIAREQLAHRATAIAWDIARPPPASALPPEGVDTVLAIFTLSALPPEDLTRAFTQLAAALRPGGQLLLRDYARLDAKHLKFARATHARLPHAEHVMLPASSTGGEGGEGGGCEWYARGDGTTALFLTIEAVHELASAAGLLVDQLDYDRRLIVNRSSRARMHRVWLVGRLTKPTVKPEAEVEAAPRGSMARRAVGLAAIALLVVAACRAASRS